MSAKPEIFLSGSGVSAGIAWGQVLKIDSRNRVTFKVEAQDVEAEVRRFQEAIELSKRQVQGLKARLEEKVGEEHGVILDMHFLILEDRMFQDEIINGIRKYRVNTEWVLAQATDHLVEAYKSLEDEYFRERYSDIEHVAERILMNLSGEQPFNLRHLPDDVVLVARNFSPSNFAVMDLGKVRGLVAESGGRTSHAAILCRGLRLPAVTGVKDLMASISTGDLVMLSGDSGQVVVNPAPERVAIEVQRKRLAELSPATQAEAGLRSRTRDGVPVTLRANTEWHHETSMVRFYGAEGIGLYRSEFFYFGHPGGKPSMEEQLGVYSRLAEEMQPHPVAIRTLDVGADKSMSPESRDVGTNANMGMRGIRLSLRSRDMFLPQVEAILRAAAHGRVEMVLPMVSTIEEVREVRAIIAEVRDTLASSGVKVPEVPLGVMLEVPAAVLMMESLATEADFFCVGTNDLIQYLMAVDRANTQVAYLYQPLHPCVLNYLNYISKIAAKVKKPVSICGEISTNPFFAVLLLGMGFTQLSMNPPAIPLIRQVLGETALKDAQKIAHKALSMVSAKDVYDYLIPAVSRMVSQEIDAWSQEINPGNWPSR
ncbi:MAG: phosphoenolpyruvate--protein phosphotransferase [Acidobacteriota bacterium]|jgi:phosphotransferase system enzyme I (PtsI)|nr:phosphoenolpyruvate--protein phosphotransferase [Acidobacteriota bacterium]